MREIAAVRVEIDYTDGAIERHAASKEEVHHFIKTNPFHWALVRQYLTRFISHPRVEKTT